MRNSECGRGLSPFRLATVPLKKEVGQVPLDKLEAPGPNRSRSPIPVLRDPPGRLMTSVQFSAGKRMGTGTDVAGASPYFFSSVTTASHGSSEGGVLRY